MNKPQNKTDTNFTILGAGPAGLGVGYFAKKNGLSFTIYEGSDRVGGNCITLRHGDFLFDSGAHRLHNKDPEITQEIQTLHGNDKDSARAPCLNHLKPNDIFHPSRAHSP